MKIDYYSRHGQDRICGVVHQGYVGRVPSFIIGSMCKLTDTMQMRMYLS